MSTVKPHWVKIFYEHSVETMTIGKKNSLGSRSPIYRTRDTLFLNSRRRVGRVLTPNTLFCLSAAPPWLCTVWRSRRICCTKTLCVPERVLIDWNLCLKLYWKCCAGPRKGVLLNESEYERAFGLVITLLTQAPRLQQRLIIGTESLNHYYRNYSSCIRDK